MDTLQQRIYTQLKAPKGRGRPPKVNLLEPFEKCKSVDDIAEILNTHGPQKLADLKAFVQKREGAVDAKKASSSHGRKRAANDDDNDDNDDDDDDSASEGEDAAREPQDSEQPDDDANGDDADDVSSQGQRAAGEEGGRSRGSAEAAAGVLALLGGERPKKKKRKIKTEAKTKPGKSATKTKSKPKPKRRAPKPEADEEGEPEDLYVTIRNAIAHGLEDGVKALIEEGGALHGLMGLLTAETGQQ